MEYASPSTTLPEMIRQSVQRFAQQTAFLDPVRESEYKSIKYAEMWVSILQVATQLMQHGIMRGDRVGLLAQGRSWWPICDVGIMASGAWTVPIYTSLPANQVQYIVHHSGMRAIFVENNDQLLKLLVPNESVILDLDFVVLLDTQLIAADLNAPWPIYTFQEWLQTISDESVVLDRMSSLAATDVASIVYTSGTTGMPKGVMLTHDNFIANVSGIQQVLDVTTADRTLSYLPLSHIFERTAGQFFILCVGASIAYSRGFAYIPDDLKRVLPTIMTSVPRFLEKVYERVQVELQKSGRVKQQLFRFALRRGEKVRVAKQAQPDFTLALYDRIVFSKIKNIFGQHLRVIVSGGAPLSPQVGTFFAAAGILILEGYGMTETAPVIAVNRPEAVTFGTVGFPLHGVEISFAPDGELLVKGRNVTPGYFRNEEATRELLSSDGWLHTGDIAQVTEDGHVKITDRKKNLIVLSTGKKVAPAPIESDVLGSPYIDQILFVGQSRKYITAIIVPAVAPLEQWLKEQGRILSADKWSRDPMIYSFLMKEVLQRIRTYAAFEQPKKLLIAKEPFTVENGLLTPTLKIRAKSVFVAYEIEIDALYASDAQEYPHASNH